MKWALTVQKIPLELFPERIDEWILEWMQACPHEAGAICFQNPLSLLAAVRLSRRKGRLENTSARPDRRNRIAHEVFLWDAASVVFRDLSSFFFFPQR